MVVLKSPDPSNFQYLIAPVGVDPIAKPLRLIENTVFRPPFNVSFGQIINWTNPLAPVDPPIFKEEAQQ